MKSFLSEDNISIRDLFVACRVSNRPLGHTPVNSEKKPPPLKKKIGSQLKTTQLDLMIGGKKEGTYRPLQKSL